MTEANTNALTTSFAATPPRVTCATVVIPCFEESSGIENLATSLRQIAELYRENYEFHFILVDDGSTDDTWELMREHFANWNNTKLIRHERNRGLMAAIITGALAASTEIVCSMDSDCTVNPELFPALVERLDEDVALVTSSPYHPLGRVNNVPGWRIFLSRSASRIYRLILRNKLYCYTSCFRVFRKSIVAELQLQHTGFVGTAEIIWRIEQKGDWRIVEVPTTLNVRQFGTSKCRTARVILRHLALMATIVFSKFIGAK